MKRRPVDLDIGFFYFESDESTFLSIDPFSPFDTSPEPELCGANAHAPLPSRLAGASMNPSNQ